MNSETAIPPRRKKVRRASTERRRREILDAALRCFLKNGVAGTTIEEIRTASNASHGSIYHLFSGKDEIALTLFVEGMQVYHEKIMQALKQATTAKACIRTIIATHLQIVVDDPPLSLYLTRLGMADDLGPISEQYKSLRGDFVRAVYRHLEPFVERGELVRLPIELYFSQIVGPAAHLSRHWLCGRVSFDLLSATDYLAEAAWQSLRARRPQRGSDDAG